MATSTIKMLRPIVDDMVEHNKVFSGVSFQEILGHSLQLVPGCGQPLILKGFLALLWQAPGEAPLSGGQA
jgi:hypothetical protein